ncbi:MAG: hypothetical protein NTZ05_01190, partial [Chloroflexi bacterium]|nr:hypothetical protein [Chloroflexota bacterium]
KGMVRADDDGRFSLPDASFQATLILSDPQGRAVQETPVRLDDTGSFSAEAPLSVEAATGGFRFTLKFGEQTHTIAGFQVAEYRTPEFSVAVRPTAKEIVAGNSLTVDVNAGYYFGAPVAGAAVRWRVTSRPYSFRLDSDPGWSFEDRDPDPDGRDQQRFGETRASGQGVTSAGGSVSFTVPTDLSKDTASLIYAIETTITDPQNNQEVSDRAEVVVHKGAFYLGLRPRRFVGTAGTATEVELLAVTPDKAPAPGTTASVAIARRVWNTVREQDADGSARYVSRPQDTPVTTQQVTAGTDGRAVVRFTPADGGLYRVVATGKDAAGNAIRSAATVWISGKAYVPWRVDDHDRIELVADKTEYQVGDTAKVLVPSPFADATALITDERGKILSRQVTRLAGNSATIDVPITDDLLPTAYVSVVLLRGAGTGTERLNSVYRLGYATVNVAISTKRLQVAVQPDRAKFGPGDTVN